MSLQTGRTQTSLGGLAAGSSRTTQFRNDSQQPPIAGNSNSHLQFDDGNATEEANITGKRHIPDWIARSSLMRLSKTSHDTEHVCFFEPLNYCVPGSLINGFCDFHRHNMFNVENTMVGMLIRNGREKLMMVKNPRKLIKWPTQLRTDFIRVFPIVELCDNIEDFEQNLNLSLFAYNLMQQEKKIEKVHQIVKEHKAYIMRIMRMYTPSETTARVEDSKISQYFEAWLKNQSHDLNNSPFNIKIVYVSNDEESDNLDGESTQLRWLSLQECSVITQAIALLYETPYVISRSLNNACLSVPPAFTVLNEKTLVLDCTKAAHGTTFSQNIPAYGDPATLSMFRSDGNENVTFIREGYNPNREICFYSKIDKKALLKDVRVEEIAENTL